MNKRQTGNIYEQIAADYLVKNGYVILERNYYTRRGEIDIIAKDTVADCIVFVEVKYRSGTGKGAPYEAVTKNKLFHITKAAQAYMLMQGNMEIRSRIDVISILKEIDDYDIEHFQNVTGF